MEELEEQVFNTIASFRNSKKQHNEDTNYCITSKLRQRLVHISLWDSLSQDYIEVPKKKTIAINEIESKTDKIYDLHEHVQSLATEIQAIKLFLKEEFYLLKMSISKFNRNTDATKKKHYWKHIFAP